MPEPVPGEFFDELLGSSKPPQQSGGSLVPQGIETLLQRLRVASIEALMVSEAPSARAYDDIRIAGAKAGHIDPKGTGESLSDWMADQLTGLAEKCEYELAKRRVRPPRGDDGLTVNQRWQNFCRRIYLANKSGQSIRYLAMVEREKKGAIEKAIRVGRGLVQREAA